MEGPEHGERGELFHAGRAPELGAGSLGDESPRSSSFCFPLCVFLSATRGGTLC